jgi:restriction endonuclease S subunit
MSGLEAVEVKLSEVKFSSDILRVDSFFFAKEFLHDKQKLLEIKSCELVSVCDDLRSFGAYSLNNDITYRDDGIPFVRCVNMRNGFIDFSDFLYIDEQANELLWKSAIKPNTVLLSMSGSVGDVAYAQESWDYPINSNQDIAKISFKDSYNPYVAYTFMLSKYGQNFMIREARGSVQQHVYLSQIEKMRLPIFGSTFCKMIEWVSRQSHDSRDNADKSYKDAEQLLLAELGLTNFIPSTEPVAIKSFSDSFGANGRLDAEYCQPKYESYHKILCAYAHGTTTIENAFATVKTTFDKSRESYPYIEIGDINVGDGSFVCNDILTADLPANAKIRANKGDLLISKVRPYRGAVAIVDNDIDNLVVSGAFTVLREKSSYPKETLAVLLRSTIYRDWLLKWSVGSSYPVIKDDDVLGMVIPNLPSNVHDDIKLKMNDSYSLRQQSEQLLELAQQAVEIAIESNEDEALIFLRNRHKN